MSRTISFLAQHPDTGSALRDIRPDGARLCMDIPESERATAVGYWALKDCVFRVTIEVVRDREPDSAPPRRRTGWQRPGNGEKEATL